MELKDCMGVSAADALPSINSAILPESPALKVEMVWQDAKEIYTTGRAIDFMLRTFHAKHVGDELAAVCLVLSYASKFIPSCKGIHIMITALKGAGKTHAVETLLQQIPDDYRSEDEMSDRAIFYSDVKEGTVIVLDDQNLSEDLQSSIKRATSDNRRSTGRKTVVNQKGERKIIPARTIWWFVKTHSVGDDQILDRCFNLVIDESEDQKRAIREFAIRSAKGEVQICDEETSRNEHICREMWNLLLPKDVKIPFADELDPILSQLGNRDTFMFLDVIKCFALLHNRPEEDGYIIADRRDSMAAMQLYKALEINTGPISHKLTKHEWDIIKCVLSNTDYLEEWTINDFIQRMPHLKYHDVYRAFEGRKYKDTHYPGLLDKFPSIQKIENKSVYDPVDNCRRGGVAYKFSNLPELCQTLPTAMANQKTENATDFPQNNDNNKKYKYHVQELISGENQSQPSSDRLLMPCGSLATIPVLHKYNNGARSDGQDNGLLGPDRVCQNDGKDVETLPTSDLPKTFPPWLTSSNVERMPDIGMRYLKPYCHFCEEYEEKKVKAPYYDRVNRLNLCESCYVLLRNQEKENIVPHVGGETG